MRVIAFLFLSILNSCTSRQLDKSYSIDIDQAYQGVGIEKFFLAQQPSWSNFSLSGQCRRKSMVRYMNYEAIKKAYALNYTSIVNFQHITNRKFSDELAKDANAELRLKDESFIFYNAYEQIIGGGRDFVIPEYKRISLLWIDPYLHNPSQLKKIIELESFQKGFPILISDCLSSKKFEKYISKHGLGSYGVKYMGADMFSPYNIDSKLSYSFSINIKEYLKNKDIFLFGQRIPESIIGIEENHFIKTK
jgi:hypothetical protein